MQLPEGSPKPLQPACAHTQREREREREREMHPIHVEERAFFSFYHLPSFKREVISLTGHPAVTCHETLKEWPDLQTARQQTCFKRPVSRILQQSLVACFFGLWCVGGGGGGGGGSSVGGVRDVVRVAGDYVAKCSQPWTICFLQVVLLPRQVQPAGLQ